MRDPGKSKEETTPEYKRNFFRVIPDSDTLEIIINVSNFDHRRGGFWLPVKMGTFSEVQRQMAGHWAAEWSVITILLGFSVFFLFFFILSPKDKMMIFLCIATFGLALRPLFTSHFLILNLINLDWIWIIRFEYLGLYTIIIGWSWFIINIYPSAFIRLITWFNTILYSLAFVATYIPSCKYLQLYHICLLSIGVSSVHIYDNQKLHWIY